jgi:hypothetical protein
MRKKIKDRKIKDLKIKDLKIKNLHENQRPENKRPENQRPENQESKIACRVWATVKMSNSHPIVSSKMIAYEADTYLKTLKEGRYTLSEVFLSCGLQCYRIIQFLPINKLRQRQCCKAKIAPVLSQ